MIKIECKLKDYIRFKVKEYNVYLLDGEWLCMCAIKHNRNIKTNCKHITACQKHLSNNNINKSSNKKLQKGL